MSGQRKPTELGPAARAAIADAEALLDQSRGVNLDPILDALDTRLRTGTGAIDARAIAHLRPELRGCADACDANHTSGRQLAGQLLCSMDDRSLASIAAATDRGVAGLVPAIGKAMFTRMTDRTWHLCGALAALIAVQGLGTMCGPMGRELPRERLQAAS